MAEWAAMARAVQRMLTRGPRGSALTEPGSALALSGTDVADLNMAFAWSDATALNQLVARPEDFVLVVAPEARDTVAIAAAELSIVEVPSPLPVWVGDITPAHGSRGDMSVRRLESTHMDQARGILAEAFGIGESPLALAFPDVIADDIDVYIDEIDGVPVSTVMAVREGPLVSLWSGGTIPSAQQRGAFGQLLDAVLLDQRSRGATTFTAITEAVASGRALRRCGAVVTCEASVWVRGDSVAELLQTPS
jgi:hypothetical protein